MTAALFILATLCADPVVPADPPDLPKGMREYFQRADALHANKAKAHDDSIAALEIALRGEGNGQVKANLKKQLKRQQELRDEVKKTSPAIFLTPNSQTGDVGRVTGHVWAVIGERSIVITKGSTVGNDPKKKAESLLFIPSYSVKSLKSRQPFDAQELFQVIGTKTENADALIAIGKNPYRVVEPIKKSDVQRFRALYDAELAAEKVEKEKAAQAKEPAPAQANPSPENP